MNEFSIAPLVLTEEKALRNWKLLNRHASLFSDLTRGDFDNYMRALLSPHVMWFEVMRTGETIGLIWLTDLEQVSDANVHVAMFDRQPSSKVELMRQLLWWLFATLPINRLTVVTIRNYWLTIRLAEKLGFKFEGCKRQAVLIKGIWQDMLHYGILRQEVEAQRVGIRRQDQAAG